MTRTELIYMVAEKTNLRQKEAQKAVKAVLVSLQETLAKEEKVTIIGFGTFLVGQRAAHVGRNPKTGQEIAIPARKVLLFRPGKELRARL